MKSTDSVFGRLFIAGIMAAVYFLFFAYLKDGPMAMNNQPNDSFESLVSVFIGLCASLTTWAVVIMLIYVLVLRW